MSDTRTVTTPQVSARMSRQRRRDTVPEVALRRILHARGRRFRVDRAIPGMARRRADLLFTRAKVAVFVDGCFWHVCPEHATQPANNGAWWAEKLRRNQERDRQTDAHLADLGWMVVRIWEHVDPNGAADTVEAALDGALPAPGHGSGTSEGLPPDHDTASTSLARVAAT